MQSQIETARKRALIIAAADYHDPKLRKLRAPAIDAEKLANVLSDPGIGDFAIETVLNEPEYVVRRKVAAFLAAASRDDVLLLHFSCHGIKDDDGHLYFATPDTELTNLDATAVSAEWLNRQMGKSRSARIVLVLDCCHSGAFSAGSMARAGSGVDIKERFEGRGRVVLTASNSLEYAFEGEALSGAGNPSVFTTALVEGLETGAADRDRDSWVSIDELYEYVFDRVRATTPSQTPSKWTFGVEGDLYIARNPTPPEIEPGDLPSEVRQALESGVVFVRESAVYELGRLLKGEDAALAKAARLMLDELSEDDSRRISATAVQILSDVEQGSTRSEAQPKRQRATPPPVHSKPRVEAAAIVAALGSHPVNELASLPHPNSVQRVAYSADGRLVATAGTDGIARVFDASTFELAAQMFHGALVYKIAFSPDSRFLATTSHDGAARLWDVFAGRQVARVNHNEKTVWGIAVSSTGEHVASSGEDCTVRVWEAASGTEVFKWKKQASFANFVRDVQFSPDGHQVAAISDDRKLRVWEFASGRELLTCNVGGTIGSWPQIVAYSPDGRLMLAAGSDNNARVFDSQTGNELARLPHDKPVWRAAFSPESDYIATASKDKTARVWETGGWSEWRRFRHGGEVNAAVFCPNTQRVATASDDKTARIWDLEGNEELASLKHGGPVFDVVFSPDGQRLLTGGKEKKARIWG
jgi:WD40 repeat protein